MTDNDWLMALLLDVHQGLPRQGPGDDDSTRRALELCTELPMQPDVLDVGCGPGMQTIALAQASGGTITAVDLFEQFLDQLRESAVEAGVREQIQVMRWDMTDMPFGKHSFDLIWSEGAAYIMGITNAFQGWKQFLRPQGYIAITEIVWLTDDVPGELHDYFHGEYPGITDVPGTLERIEKCGYEIVDHFTLPDASWWTHYYDPLAQNLKAMRGKYALDTQALRFIDESEEEQRLRRDYPDLYGYEFIVSRLIDPDAYRPRESLAGLQEVVSPWEVELDESAGELPLPDPPAAETVTASRAGVEAHHFGRRRVEFSPVEVEPRHSG